MCDLGQKEELTSSEPYFRSAYLEKDCPALLSGNTIVFLSCSRLSVDDFYVEKDTY